MYTLYTRGYDRCTPYTPVGPERYVPPVGPERYVPPVVLRDIPYTPVGSERHPLYTRGYERHAR